MTMLNEGGEHEGGAEHEGGSEHAGGEHAGGEHAGSGHSNTAVHGAGAHNEGNEAHDHPQTEHEKQEARAMDCKLFEMVRYSHLITFILQIIGFTLKFKEYFNTSQILQGMVIPWFYLGAVLYTIFECRIQHDFWEIDETGAGHGK